SSAPNCIALLRSSSMMLRFIQSLYFSTVLELLPDCRSDEASGIGPLYNGWLNRRADPPPRQLLCDLYRSAHGGIFIEPARHSTGQADTTVRSSKRRHISLMHCIPASEEHGIGHLRAVEMGTRWAFVLARVNVRPHNIAIIIYVIAEQR